MVGLLTDLLFLCLWTWDMSVYLWGIIEQDLYCIWYLVYLLCLIEPRIMFQVWCKSPPFVVDVSLLSFSCFICTVFFAAVTNHATCLHGFMALCSLQIYTNINDNLCNTSLSTFCNCKFRVLINVKTWICKQYIQNECPFTLLSRFYLSSMINRDTSAQESYI